LKHEKQKLSLRFNISSFFQRYSIPYKTVVLNLFAPADR